MENEAKEMWKPFPPCPTKYEVSSLGRVRSRGAKKILRLYTTTKGYQHIRLGGKGYFVHRMVALTLIGPMPSETHQVNHINGIKHDNRVENLEWVTPEENYRHAKEVLGVKAFADPEGQRGENNSIARFRNEDVVIIKRLGALGLKNYEIAEVFGVPNSTIGSILCGQSWGHIQV